MDNTHSTENKTTSEWRKREMGALWKEPTILFGIC